MYKESFAGKVGKVISSTIRLGEMENAIGGCRGDHGLKKIEEEDIL